MTKSNRFSILIKITLASLVIFCISMWAYYGTTQNAFVWDTIFYIPEHIFYLTYPSIDNVIWMFFSLDVANWHPLTWLSWAIDYQVYRSLEPWGYHLSSNILHSLNSVLVFVLTLVVFGLNSNTTKRYSISTSNNALIAAALTALVWAVHPQHVESVAWIAERKDLLCQFFILLSILAYVKFVSCDKPKKRRWYYGTLVMFLLAVLSKPMAVTFPAIMLLIDVYPLRRTNVLGSILPGIKTETYSKLLIEKIPFFMLSLFLVLITLKAQTIALTSMPLDLRLLNAFNSMIFYIENLMIPTSFSPHYSYFIDEGGSITWNAFVPIAAVLGISLATIVAWLKGRPEWLVAWLFYLITLSPVLGLIQVGQQGAADRYAYLPTLPIYLLFSAGLLWLLNKANIAVKIVVILAVLCILIGLIYKTRLQILIWESELTLWSHSVEQNPENTKSLHNLGIELLKLNEYSDAAENFNKVLELKPTSLTSQGYRALSYLFLGQYEDALRDYSDLKSNHESSPEVQLDWNCVNFNIGWANAQLSNTIEAVELFNAVNPETQLGPDAASWITSLSSEQIPLAKQTKIEKLPAFCRWVFQSKIRVEGIRQDELGK